MNEIIVGRYEDALTKFGQLDFLPMKKHDDVQQRASLFNKLDSYLQSLIFDCIIAISKLTYILNYQIVKDPNFYMDYSTEGQKRREKI